MPPKGKKSEKANVGSGGRGLPSPAKKRRSKSEKAGLTFSVQHAWKAMKRFRYAPRVLVGSAVYITAVVEYLIAEILEISGNCAKDNKKHRITPRHMQLAIRNDEELCKLFEHITLPEAGVLPNIHSVLLPKASQKTNGTTENLPTQQPR